MATIGDRIHFIRSKRGVTQEELASAVGTTKQNIYKYEKNVITNIPMDKVEQISAFLNVSPAWIMGWSKETEPTPTYLSENEKSLVYSFRSLSNEGKDYILQQIAIAQQIYRKSETVSDLESKNA